MKNKIIILCFVVVLGGLLGCNKYLDVAPKSSLSEEEFFTSEAGFQQALYGVYSQMASRPMYGDYLSMGFVSALAQNYTGTQSPYANTIALNFNHQEVLNYTDAIWRSTYNAIAGLNNILAHTVSNRDVLSAATYNLIKGEALGLRAYMHLDLLRLFGATFANDPDKKAIPYHTEVTERAVIPSTTAEVIAKALEDLVEAASLLESVDPIRSGSTDRKYQMNYYAVKGLEARIQLYKGDKTAAFQAAQVVIDSDIFTFVQTGAVSAAASVRDRLFSPELVFALRSRNITDWAEQGFAAYFRYTSGTQSLHLSRTDANYQTIYETAAGGSTDIRYNFLFEQDGPIKFSSKFWQTWTVPRLGSVFDTTRMDQTVPLIRMSEMYYILAETAASPQQGAVYLNEVRRNRGLTDLNAAMLTEQQLQNEIMKEYQKEFYGEGQLFFYYKRLNITSLQLPTTITALMMTPANYILPIPADEVDFNPNYE